MATKYVKIYFPGLGVNANIVDTDVINLNM